LSNGKGEHGGDDKGHHPFPPFDSAHWTPTLGLIDGHFVLATLPLIEGRAID
jgi:hypothetical protein